MTFSPDGRYLCGVLLGSEMKVLVWDLDRDGACQVAGNISKGLTVTSFSPDSRLLAFASQGKKVLLWNTVDSQVQAEIELPLEPSGSLGFAPDGKLAVHCYQPDE